MGQGPVMPRKPLDIKLTDYPFGKERSTQLLFPAFPARDGCGQSPQKLKQPQQKAGANVSIILGHFQKCLTVFMVYKKSSL